MENPTDPSRLDDAFDLLRNPYRRRILIGLYDHRPREGDALSLEEFVTDHEDPAELRTVLSHCHLPKLAAHGCIEWDPDTGQIRRGPDFDAVAPFLAVVLDHEDDLSAMRS